MSTACSRSLSLAEIVPIQHACAGVKGEWPGPMLTSPRCHWSRACDGPTGHRRVAELAADPSGRVRLRRGPCQGRRGCWYHHEPGAHPLASPFDPVSTAGVGSARHRPRQEGEAPREHRLVSVPGSRSADGCRATWASWSSSRSWAGWRWARSPEHGALRRGSTASSPQATRRSSPSTPALLIPRPSRPCTRSTR